MTINGTQDWHSVEPQATDNTTVRQPTPQYDTLHTWAKDAQLSEVFELTALTFGFSKHFTVIGNLNQELSHPESLEILAAWSNNPLVALLSDLRQAFTDSSDIAIEFPALPHAGNSDQTKKKLRDLGASIEKRHFLLCLIVNPLAIANTEEQYALRRALRIWLIVQALDHAANRRCLSDKRIQKVASFLTQNTHHNNWLIIDKTLERAKRHVALQPFTFDRFTLALRNAANELFVQSQDASAQRFLNSLVLICEGNCEPNELENVAQPFFHAPLAIFSRNQLPETQQLSDYQFQSLDLLDAPNDESDENSEEALLYTVNADDPPERQRLTGQSILLQTTELSHYLPWSWDKPLPPELQSLNAWINQLLTSNNQLDRLGAAVVWLATRLSRSLPFTLELAISSTTQNEWALMPDFSVAHRHSPKRHHSWVPDQNAIQCIEPFESSLSLKIPGVVQQALNGAFESAVNSNHSLYNLWFQLSGETPETWFNRHAKDHFPRLTSAKLANAHPQQVFNLTSDHSFARLSAAHPRAALPAACGYANWDIKAVENGFNLELSGSDKAGDSRVNVLGSLLAPLESLLIDQISQATQALNDTQWDSPLSYHNALARYCVMALYAATGCRHLSDPFESITHFCSEPPSVFINDKADDGLHNGRLVPLPLGAWNLVEMYKTHLGELAKVIEPVRSDLAEEISQLRKQPSAKLPLFFLLDEAIHWRSLSDRSIPDTEWFNWPLPSNLFRHRYAQQLARSGVDTEVIDGWMGHAERGVATYSDLSVRCWIDDYQAYSQTLNDVFERLVFQVPRTLGQLPPIGEPTTLIKPIAQESRLFGVKKRRQNRIASLKKAKDLADSDLDLFLGSKTLEELDDDQTQAMSHLMLMRENGLPHPQAAIRYAVMMERLDALEDESAKPIRRRLVTIDTEQSLLTDQSPVALTILLNP